MRAPPLVLLAGAMGCAAPTASTPCSIHCAADRACPSGMVCAADGWCHADEVELCEAPDGPASTPDARAADAAAEPDGPVLPSGPVTVTFGDRSGADRPGTCPDTWVDDNHNGANYGASAAATIDGDPDQRMLWRCDLGSIPTTATVLAATLHLASNANGLEGGSLYLFPLLEGWSEGNGDGATGAASWNQRESGIAWSTPGAGSGSHDGTPAAVFTPSAPNTDYAVTLSTATVQTWVAHPGVNFGVVFKASQNASVALHTRESATADFRPLLEVLYQP